MKARVYQLAKELDRKSKDLIKVLTELGIEVKNHMSTLTEDQVMRARAHLMPRVQPTAPPPPSPRPLKPPPPTLPTRPTLPPPPGGRRIVPPGSPSRPPGRRTPGDAAARRTPTPTRPPGVTRGPGVPGRGPGVPGRGPGVPGRGPGVPGRGPGVPGRGPAAGPGKGPAAPRRAPPRPGDRKPGAPTTAAPPAPEYQKPGRGIGGRPTRPPGRGGPRPQRGGGRPPYSPQQRTRPKIRRKELTGTSVDLSSRTEVAISLPTTVREFSAETGIKVSVLLRKLMTIGMMGNINSSLNEELVELLAQEFKFDDKLKIKTDEKAEDRLMADFEAEDKQEDLVDRPPIVTFLGHVDHGKTSLLDAIRGANVQASEAGGITQHLSAFKVKAKEGKEVVFLDTPGHEAFTKMRARGADVTDVVVLVVAADDGVMPQTEEAISHAKAAEVKIVVALNKIDVPGANIDKVKAELAAKGLQSQDWGGDTEIVQCSAITREGLDDLLETLTLESELMELKANPNRMAQGHVLEATVSGGMGVLTKVLVKNGTLRPGDFIIAGQATGRVRALIDDAGQKVSEAPPATPVEVLGLNHAPEAGEPFIVVKEEKQAKDVVAERQQRRRGALALSKPPATLEEIMKGISEKKLKEVKVLLKADVQGSVEVLNKEITDLSTDEVKVTVIHAQVGGINESDVTLANASGALVIGFNVIADERARSASEIYNVPMEFYSVIYKITEDLRAAMEGMLEPEEKEEITGHIEIRKVFKISRLGNIAGCYVTDGLVNRSSRVRLARDGIVIHKGRLESLKREKNDVREVKAGLECGIKLESYDNIKEGDTVEAYEIIKVKRTLST